MNDTTAESISSGAGSAMQTGAVPSGTIAAMQPDGLGASPVRPTIETFHLSELEQKSDGNASGFQNPGEVLHRTVIDAGGIHAGMQKIANGDFETHSDEADFGVGDDRGAGGEIVDDREAAEVGRQSQVEEAVLSGVSPKEPQVKADESLPKVDIDNNSPANELASQSEPAAGFAPTERSVPEDDLEEDLLKLLGYLTEKIEEEEDPEERVSLVEALIALIKAMVALGIKVAKEAGKDLIKPMAPKEI